MQTAFSPARVAEREDPIGTLAEALVDEMVAEAGEQRHADVLSCVLFPLPLIVILRLIGIPEDQLERSTQAAKDWNDLSAAFVTGVSLDEQLRMADSILEFHRYLVTLIAERGRRPADDLVSALVAVRKEEGLSDRELLSLLPGLVFAGHETTASLLAKMLLLLLGTPARWDSVRHGDVAVPDVVEEVLRYDGPVIGMPRVVTA